jgi:hypothetical protein
MNWSIHAHGSTRLQRLLDIPIHVRNAVGLDIHHGVIVALVVAQLHTRVDLRASTTLPQGASPVAFENLIQEYDEASYGGGLHHVFEGPDLVGSRGPLFGVHLLVS